MAADIMDLVYGNTDLYTFIFALLGVPITGDVVRDVVYKIVIPSLFVYAFIKSVAPRMFEKAKETGATLLIEAVILFIIIYEGYYPVFASWSLPLFMLMIIYNTFRWLSSSKFDSGAPRKEQGFLGRVFERGTSKMGSDAKDALLKAANAQSKEVRALESNKNELEKSITSLDNELTKIHAYFDKNEKYPEGVSGEDVEALEKRLGAFRKERNEIEIALSSAKKAE